MFDKNELFKKWRAELEKRGVTIRWLWSAKSHPDMRYDDIALASFYGNGFQPGESTAVIQDYTTERKGSTMDRTGDGFGVWFQSRFGDIGKETDHIAKPFNPQQTAAAYNAMSQILAGSSESECDA